MNNLDYLAQLTIHRLRDAPRTYPIHQAASNSIDPAGEKTQPAYQDASSYTQALPLKTQYVVDELLNYQDRALLNIAYRALLRRPPDKAGLENYLEKLRLGTPREFILVALRYSPEGRKQAISVRGIKRAALYRGLCNIPLLGWVIESITLVVSMPRLAHRIHKLELHKYETLLEGDKSDGNGSNIREKEFKALKKRFHEIEIRIEKLESERARYRKK